MVTYLWSLLVTGSCLRHCNFFMTVWWRFIYATMFIFLCLWHTFSKCKWYLNDTYSSRKSSIHIFLNFSQKLQYIFMCAKVFMRPSKNSVKYLCKAVQETMTTINTINKLIYYILFTKMKTNQAYFLIPFLVFCQGESHLGEITLNTVLQVSSFIFFWADFAYSCCTNQTGLCVRNHQALVILKHHKDGTFGSYWWLFCTPVKFALLQS